MRQASRREGLVRPRRGSGGDAITCRHRHGCGTDHRRTLEDARNAGEPSASLAGGNGAAQIALQSTRDALPRRTGPRRDPVCGLYANMSAVAKGRLGAEQRYPPTAGHRLPAA